MKKIQAIRIDKFGGPEVMDWREIEVAEPGPGEVLLRHTAVGLNFIDTYHRSGLYPLELPSGLGTEAAGVVEACGPDVDHFKPGDRVTYVGMPPDAYSQARVFSADRLVQLPDEIADQTAAAGMLKGLMAWYLLHRSYPVSAGDTVLLYAAAGGVGSITTQWACSLGVKVIGVVSTDAKADLATQLGCAHIVRSDSKDFLAEVKSLTGGEGVAAVYDSIGRDTFYQSLDCLRPHGTMVSYGNATGAVEPFSPLELARRGSLFLTRPVVFDFLTPRQALEDATMQLFDRLLAGDITITVNQKVPLQQAADAHRALESRATTGSTVLLP
ncbi:MAG: quinone oxidoreductase family protein [Gammaproteobacteria bacterium]